MAWPAAQDRLVILGCRVRQMVAVVARSASAQVLLVAMVAWASTEGVMSLPLVCSCGGGSAADEQEQGVELCGGALLFPVRSCRIK
jgi:hypothetical protein